MILQRSRNTIRLRSSSALQGLDRLPAVPIIQDRFDNVDINDFRQRAFLSETPVLMTTRNENESTSAKTSTIPAAVKWFLVAHHNDRAEDSKQALALSQAYLAPFGATILPYELTKTRTPAETEHGSSKVENYSSGPEGKEMRNALATLVEGSPQGTFHRFHAPLSLFLQVYNESPKPPYQLYIAQAQIADLPKQLQEDLPTPRLVREAGKGDLYDANIWIGMPPTYTPLHKDPNPNLFVQLASSKRVRLFKPGTGLSIFRDVQRRIGGSSSSTFRGEEMMDGPERHALEDTVWGERSGNQEGFEVTVSPGDALFIPKGWWHSIKSIGTDVTASVNWWFR